MKIGLIGGTYQEDSLPFNSSRSVNLFPVMDQYGKEVAAMYGPPGKRLFGSLGIGPWREIFTSRAKNRCFGVSGSSLYEINSDGTGIVRGSLLQSSGIVYMSENPNQLAICDGQNLYIMTYSTNLFEQVVGGREFCANGDFASGAGWTTGAGWSIGAGVATAVTSSAALSRTAAYTLVQGRTYTATYTLTRSAGTSTLSIGGTAGVAKSASGTYTELIIAGATQELAFTGAGFSGTVDNVSVIDNSNGFIGNIGTLDFIDGFFVVSHNNTRNFYKSGPNDGLSWNALDFAGKSSSPDNLGRVKQAVGQLWLLGQYTSEVWTNTGASAFPFQRIAGAKLTEGILSPASAAELDNSIIWLGRDKDGAGIVYRAKGFTPERISTTPIELIISRAADPANIRYYSYQKEGHLFYVLTGGGLETSPTYDLTTGFWVELASTGDGGLFAPDRGICGTYAFGELIIGDKDNSNLYVLDQKTYDDNGTPIISERIFTTISDEDKQTRYNRLAIYLENGVGTETGYSADPQIELYTSTDGGRTWFGPEQASIGPLGEYRTEVVFYRLGVAKQMTFKLRISDPVKRRIIGAYLS